MNKLEMNKLALELVMKSKANEIANFFDAYETSSVFQTESNEKIVHTMEFVVAFVNGKPAILIKSELLKQKDLANFYSKFGFDVYIGDGAAACYIDKIELVTAKLKHYGNALYQIYRKHILAKKSV